MNPLSCIIRRVAAVLTSLLIAAAAHAEGLIALTTTNLLLTLDSSTPGTIATSVGITGLQGGETLLGVDQRPANGLLYGLGSTSRLYSIDQTTGVATQVGSSGSFTLSGTAFGFDFNPSVDRIRVVSNTGQDLRLNPNDGTLTATDTALAFAVGDPNAATTPRVVGSAYSNNTAGASPTTLFGIDSNLDILVMQGSPGGSPVSPNTGQLFTIGALGFNTSDLVGFDISGTSGIGYASFTSPVAATSQLFTINLATGAASLLGTIGGGVPVHGLAVRLAATPSVPDAGSAFVYLGMGLGALVALRRFVRRQV